MSVTRTVTQFKGRDDDLPDADAAAHARNMLMEKFRSAGEVMDADPTPSEPMPVVLNADRTGWTEVGPRAWCDGWVITWTATGHPVVSDVVLEGGVTHPSGAFYMVPVPDEVTASGGPVRVRHNLGAPVTVKAYTHDSEPVGYLFAAALSDDEEQVELLPGTVRLHVIRDAEDADA